MTEAHAARIAELESQKEADRIANCNLVEALARAEAKLALATVWQPIWKAPKDGTPILVAEGEDVGENRWDEYIEAWEQGGSPTDWMPMPEPPKRESRKGK